MRKKRIFSVFLAAALTVSTIVIPSQTVYAISPDIVISQVYGGGGNTGASYTHDYVELFNRGTSTISLAGWSIQYASASGTTFFSSNVTLLTGSVAPKTYHLIRLASGGATGVALPTPDDTGSIAMSATGGKVILANTSTGLACNGGSTTCSPSDLASIIDLAGFGSANFYEGSGPAPAPSNTTSILRLNAGCREYDDNKNDFAADTPSPRNSSTAAATCNSTSPSSVGSANPTSVSSGGNTLLAVSVLPGDYPPSTGLSVTANLSAVGGPSAQPFYDDGSHGDIAAGDNVFSFGATVSPGTAPGAKNIPFTGTDIQARSFSATIPLTIQYSTTPIHDIQGSSHLSTLNGTQVTTQGIVTGLRSRGFYMQSDSPDANDATSEGIYVLLDSAPAVNVGDAVIVTGTVLEGMDNPSTECLKTTRVTNPGLAITVTSTGNPLPTPIVLGIGGHIPPNTNIEDDATNVESNGTFDPDNDAIDFFESLEGMLVQVNDPVAVGPTDSANELPVLPDNGANASVRTTRGGIVVREISPGRRDYNPERIILDDEFSVASMPNVNAGAHLSSPVIGVMDYIVDYFGGCNYKMEVTSTPIVLNDSLTRESASTPNAGELSIATFNVENLDPGDPPAKFSELAAMVINDLKSPDLLAIEEVQDNNGSTNDGTVDASTTWAMLINAITTAGGPIYSYRQINPLNDQDGGDPGGNIRVGFLFRTDHGLAFVDRPGAASTTANSVISGTSGPELKYSPGRIDPTNSSFSVSRKPLTGEFTYNGNKIFVIANHFSSKGGDQPLFGKNQPALLSSEAKRVQQATVVKNFVQAILAVDANANIVVLGDMNDYEFSNPLAALESTPLHILTKSLPQAERYTYVYEGNSQAIDHTLLSDALFARPFEYDIVHVNAEFNVQVSDHDPQVTHIFFDNTNWQVEQVGDILHIHYDQGNTVPEYASLHLQSGYFRLNYGPTSGWGTSVLLMPAFWSGGVYYQGAPVTGTWQVDGPDLVLTINGVMASQSPGLFSLAVTSTVRLSPPEQDSMTAQVSTTTSLTGTLSLDTRPGEAFKPVMLSSMHISASQWDTQSAYAGCRNYSPPESGWFLPSPVDTQTFGLHGGTSMWKTNSPTLEVVLNQSMPVTGWVTPSADPNDDNVALWAASDQVLSSWSFEIHAFSSFDAPQPLSPPNGKLTLSYTPELDWDEITGGTSYQVQLASNMNFDPVLYEQIGASSMYLVPSALNPNMQYHWRVQGCNAAGRTSTWSPIHVFETPLATPETLSSPASNEHVLSLRPLFDWNDVSGGGYYTIQVSKNNDFTQVVLDEGTATSDFTPRRDLPPAMQLYWHVRSEGVGGTGKWSAIQSFWTPNPPGVPILISPNRDALTIDYRPLFKWNPVFVPRHTEFDHYQIQISSDADFSTLEVNEDLSGVSTRMFAPAADLAANTQYYWRVRAFNIDNEVSSWSEVRSFHTPNPLINNNRPRAYSVDPTLPLPEIITPLNGKNVNTLQPVLDWKDVPGATSYIIQVSTDPSFASSVFIVSATTIDSQYAFVKNVPAGGILYWRILSIHRNTISTWSSISTFGIP